MLRFELSGPRPGSGYNWYLVAHDPSGATVLHVSGPRDVVLAAFAEYVEELHAREEVAANG